jgi:hypothetical protein
MHIKNQIDFNFSRIDFLTIICRNQKEEKEEKEKEIWGSK